MSNLRIVSWNTNYWQNASKGYKCFQKWQQDCINFLKKLNANFILLQEINPLFLFEISPHHYHFDIGSNSIIYQELTPELTIDGLHSNYWGNVIIYSNRFQFIKNELAGIRKDFYYGCNGLQAYSFELPDTRILTVINFYNKSRNGYYTIPESLTKEVEQLLAQQSNNNLVIFAGDFNTGSYYKNLENKEQAYIGLFDEIEKTLQNCAKFDNQENHPTSLHNGKDYINDYCFSNFTVKKFDVCDDAVKKFRLSDHCPIIVDFDFA